ncbi:MAG: ATP synthase F1 subunit gamma [Candidatus Wildermuthbacteria bacterium]|nr:ATP synthase F1 subunit gamma [Candidatus Wildermuthbacteria bacterium]
MASKLQLKTKIRAVLNIKQITKAMQMVSATKMRKSQEVALRARPYAKHALSLLSRLSEFAKEELASGFWAKRSEGKVCLVAVTSDKGLSGTFNSSVLKMAFQAYQSMLQKKEEVDVVAVGKKAKDFFKKRGAPIAVAFSRFSDIITLPEVSPLTEWVLDSYEKGIYKEIIFCSTQFVSALVQKPEIHSVLPIQEGELRKIVESIVPKTGRYSFLGDTGTWSDGISYIMEPSPNLIAGSLSKNLVRVEILHLIFESNASEHSSRMLAMKNATENAENLGETLNLELNKARQSAITQELTEISTAKEALTSQ